MLSWFYQILWQIAPPVIRYYLRRRAQKNPAYAEHWHSIPTRNAAIYRMTAAIGWRNSCASTTPCSAW